MSGTTKLFLTIVGAVVVCYVLLSVLSMIAHFVIPIAIVAGVGIILYAVVFRKSLGGGRRTLP